MASDIWSRTILIVRKETRCRLIGYSYRLTARVLLYAPSHRQDNTYHGLCYTSRGALAGTRNSSLPKVTEAKFQTIGPLYQQSVWYLPFTNSPRKHTDCHISFVATYRKFTVATVRFTQNVSCNIYTHPIYQQVTNVTV